MPEWPKGKRKESKGKTCAMDSRCTNQKGKCTEPRHDTQRPRNDLASKKCWACRNNEVMKLAARNAGPTPPIHKGFMVYRAPPPWPHVLPEVHGCKKSQEIASP